MPQVFTAASSFYLFNRISSWNYLIRWRPKVRLTFRLKLK